MAPTAADASPVATNPIAHPLLLDPQQQQLYNQAHAHAAILAHATEHVITHHLTSEKHADLIHAQIQRHGDKHVFDLVMASVIVLIIMCAMLTLIILVYFGCVSRSFKLVPLRYLCCPLLLLCRRPEDTGGGASGTALTTNAINRSGGGAGGHRGGVGKFRV